MPNVQGGIAPNPKLISKGQSRRVDSCRVGDHVVIFKTCQSPFWYIQFNLHGHQYKPSLKTTSKKQALLLAKRRDAELTVGIARPPRRDVATILGCIEKYLASQKARVSEPTLAMYARDQKQFEAFSKGLGVLRVDQATAEHLEAFEEFLRVTGPPRIRKYMRKGKAAEKNVRGGPCQPKTVYSKMKTVRQLIKWVAKRGMIDRDPSPGYRLPPMPKDKPRPFSPSELLLILEKSEEPFRHIFDFFRLTGLRNGELCWLLKDDVDPAFRFVHIRAKICPFTGVRWRPKHGNERVVPLCSSARQIAEEAMKTSPGPWLFYAPDTTSSRPGQFKKCRIWSTLKAVLKATEIDHGTVHTFRHCFCSFLANQNLSPFLVMKFMGHSSLDIVMTYYHAGTSDLLAGMEAIDFTPMVRQQPII